MNTDVLPVKPAKLRIILGLSIFGLFLMASAFRSGGVLIHHIYRLQEALGGDKVVHLLMGLSFMSAGLLIASVSKHWQPIQVFLGVTCLMTLDEFSQIWFGTREFSMMDLAMGTTGALAMTIIFCVVTAWLGRRRV